MGFPHRHYHVACSFLATSSASQPSIRKFFSPSSSAVATDTEESEASEGQASGRSSDASSDAPEEPSTVSAEEIATKKRKLSHHRKRGVSSSWLREFPWLRSVRGANGKLGMRCYLCTSWTSDPCYYIRRDKVVKHANSRMHQRAVALEATTQAGGLPCAFEEAYSLEVKATIGCCKWLCKQEIPHYPHLIALAVNILRVLELERMPNTHLPNKFLSFWML